MPTLDFVHDASDKLDQEKVNYVMLVLEVGKGKSIVNSYINLQNEKAAQIMVEVLKKVQKNIKKSIEE